MSDELLKIIEAAVYLAVAVGGGILLPLAKKWADARIGESNSNRILDWAETFVRMAEQKMAADGGSAKYQFVYSAIEALADRNKIKIDPKSIEAAIEAAVYQLKAGQAPPVTVVGNLLEASAAAAVQQPQG
jgi:hypothetical protein